MFSVPIPDLEFFISLGWDPPVTAADTVSVRLQKAGYEGNEIFSVVSRLCWPSIFRSLTVSVIFQKAKYRCEKKKFIKE